MKNAAALLMLLLAAAPAIAKAAGDDDSVIVGPGVQSCADWTSFRDQHEDAIDMALLGWLQGFLSGLNAQRHADGRDVAALPDPNGLLDAMDGYCKANPTSRVYEGAGVLYTQF